MVKRSGFFQAMVFLPTVISTIIIGILWSKMFSPVGVVSKIIQGITNNPNYLADLEPVIKDAEGVEEVVYQRDVVETLITWTNAIRWVGGSLAGLLVVDSILIVMTIIGMKIALKKQEVEILNLVGASPWYIRAPFLLEGGLYGLFGAGIASVIIGGLTLWLYPLVLGFLGVIPAIGIVLGAPTSSAFLIAAFVFFGGLAVTGFLLGSVGSMVAVGRYLKF